MAEADSREDAGKRFTFLDDIGRDDPLRLISAYDGKTKQSVTLDVLESTSKAKRRQVLTRAQAAATLRHPDIFAVREVLHRHDPPIIVRDHDRLPSLADHLRTEGAWSPHAALRLAARMATALDRAHARGLVHGRLSPGLIRRTDPSSPYRVCGLGRPLRPIDIATIDLDELRYTAPERLDGASADKSSDLFSLGLILFALLTGRHAFDASERTLLAAQVAETEPPDVDTLAPGLPQAVSDIVTRSIMPEPGLRFRNGNEFSEALERALSLVQPSDAPATPTKRARAPNRLPFRVGSIGTVRILLFAAAIVGLAGTLYAWLRHEPEIALHPPPEETLPLPRLSGSDAPQSADGVQIWPIDPTTPETDIEAVPSWQAFAMELDRHVCTRIETMEVGDQVVLFGITGNDSLPEDARKQAAEIPTIARSFWSVAEAGSEQCRLLDALATPLRSPNMRLLQLADGRVPANHQTGDLLVLDVDAPLGAGSTATTARRWHVRVDYWMADGRVAHLVPAGGRSPVLEAGQSLRVGDPAAGEWFRFEPPGGVEWAVALLTASPLALGERTRIEPSANYLADLLQALQDSDAASIASVIAITVTDERDIDQ